MYVLILDYFHSSVQNSLLITAHVGSNTENCLTSVQNLLLKQYMCSWTRDKLPLSTVQILLLTTVQARSNTEQFHYSTEPAGYNHYTYLTTEKICSQDTIQNKSLCKILMHFNTEYRTELVSIFNSRVL